LRSDDASYEAALRWLGRMRVLFGALDREREFSMALDALRVRHHRRRKFLRRLEEVFPGC
jgi:hypothetical protein